jgi:hemerythrin
MDIEFKWTQEMSVHNDVLDGQHQELFAKINELLQAIINDEGEAMIENVVDFFEKYMNEHLVYEEEYLTKIGYPELREHHEQHVIFINKYNELKQKLFEDTVNRSQLVFDIESFMGSWLTEHLLTEDQKYAKYIQQMNEEEK